MEENNQISKSNKVKVFVLTMLILLVSVAGISYAYFTIQITGNDTASSMRLTTANYSLVYNDVQIVAGEYAIPGWSDTKTLTVTNNGNVTVNYDIVWRDLLNEINKGELVIYATCTASAGTCDDIDETEVPLYTTEVHSIGVKGDVPIAPGVTHTYTLTAEFIETGSNQNYNQNKYFNGTLNITEHKLSRVGTDSVTGLPAVRIGTERFLDITNAVDYSSLISANGNLYNYASDKTILLAENNLYVGRIFNSSDNTYMVISSSDPHYGLQTYETQGPATMNPKPAVVPFNGSSGSRGYWYDTTNNVLYSKYGSSYDVTNIYDADYATAPNWSYGFTNNANNANYSVAYYVEEYVDTLGIDGIGRLLTYAEANLLTTTQRTNGSRYWLGTCHGYSIAWYVSHDGTTGYTNFYTLNNYGVRPVIVVNTSDIYND